MKDPGFMENTSRMAILRYNRGPGEAKAGHFLIENGCGQRISGRGLTRALREFF